MCCTVCVGSSTVLRDEEVAGSNPVTPTTLVFDPPEYASLNLAFQKGSFLEQTAWVRPLSQIGNVLSWAPPSLK
jgi:hypothetical protein